MGLFEIPSPDDLGEPGDQMLLLRRFHSLRLVFATDPLNGLDRRETGEDRETADHRAGPANPAVAGNLHKLPGRGSTVEVDDGLEDDRLVGWESAIFPIHDSIRPGHATIATPLVIEIESKVGFRRPFGRNQVQPALRENPRAIRQKHLHRHTVKQLPAFLEDSMRAFDHGSS